VVDKEVLNTGIRRYLKKVGITSQEVIETAVRNATERGKLGDVPEIGVTMTLRIPELELEHTIDGNLRLL
jgi:hypothetical protein